MDKNEYNVLKIILKLYIFATFAIGIMEIVSYTSLGEAQGMQLRVDRMDILIILIIQVASLAFVYPLFLHTKEPKIHVRGFKNWHFEINYKRVHYVTFCLLLAELLFSVKTGNAILGREVSSRFSFLFNLFKISVWMPVYYVCAREKKKMIYWSNVILYVVYEFLCGWSGQILTVVFLELFLRVKHKDFGRITRLFFRFNTFLTIAAFAIGSFLYSRVYSLKNSIRYGLAFGSIPPLSIFEGAEALLSRFTNFPITVAAVQNHSKIASLYQIQGRSLWEIETILSPLLPRFIMPNKEFRPLSNIVKLAIWDDQPKGNGTGYNFFVYWFNILESNLICFLLGIVIFLVLFLISRKIILMFDDGSHDVEVLYFLFLTSLFAETSLSNNFGYGYISLVYTIPIFMIVGAIELKRTIQYSDTRFMKKDFPLLHTEMSL